MTDIANIYANDPAMRTVSLGLDVQHFISQDKVGLYLLERAHQDRIDALEELVKVDPTDQTAITALQWKAKIPDMFVTWIAEAIALGEAAETTIAVEDYDGI